MAAVDKMLFLEVGIKLAVEPLRLGGDGCETHRLDACRRANMWQGQPSGCARNEATNVFGFKTRALGGVTAAMSPKRCPKLGIRDDCIPCSELRENSRVQSWGWILGCKPCVGTSPGHC
mmetsp:Transcript_28604/g.53640  ORF Transcript_28604/g.53640 Transcript_28604/m.53640 type:complete len:119 (-) Transcript_28604:1636-1992(-)